MRFIGRINKRLREKISELTEPLEKPLRIDPASNERRETRLGEARLGWAQAVGVVVVTVTSVAVSAWDYVRPGPWKWFWGVLGITGLLVLFGLFVILYRAGRP